MALVEKYSEYEKDNRVHGFSPYSENGGTTVAICGADFVVVGCDSRLGGRGSFLTREQTKVFKLTEKTVVAFTGCWADVLTLTKDIKIRLRQYEQEHNEKMTTTAIAQLVSTLLYWKRFFPYYVSTIVAGLDEQGEGVCYHYDPVGHMEKLKFSASGGSVSQIQPLLDNLLDSKNMKDTAKPVVTREFAEQLVHDAFISASERDVNTGDSIMFYTLTSAAIREHSVPLRKD